MKEEGTRIGGIFQVDTKIEVLKQRVPESESIFSIRFDEV